MEEFISQPGPGSRRRPGRQSAGDAYSDTSAGTYQEENPDDAGQTVFFDERSRETVFLCLEKELPHFFQID